MFALFVISGIAALICGCLGIFVLAACVQNATSFAACKTRLLKGVALILVPTTIMLLSMYALFS